MKVLEYSWLPKAARLADRPWVARLIRFKILLARMKRQVRGKPDCRRHWRAEGFSHLPAYEDNSGQHPEINADSCA